MKDISGMTLAELENHLAKLKEDLEELEEEKMFTLSQTGLHVSAGAVAKFGTETGYLKAGIEETEKALNAKRAE